jgi:hypothetical protein
MKKLSTRTVRWRSMDDADKDRLKGEVMTGLAKIKCVSIYNQPSQKIADNHRYKYGLCQHCEHLQLAAAESIILMAKCKEIKVGLNSSRPVTECSWYIDDRAPIDASDFMHIATLIDIEEDNTAGF